MKSLVLGLVLIFNSYSFAGDLPLKAQRDENAGDRSGQGVGGVWLLLKSISQLKKSLWSEATKNILFLILAGTLFSCSYSHTSGGPAQEVPQTGLTDPKPGEEPAVRYTDVDRAVFASSCTGCHQKKGLDLSFADYTNSKSFASEIFVRVFEDQDMPPRGNLTELQLQVLRTWIESGSPE